MKAALLFITCLLALFIMTNGNPEADSQGVDEALLFFFFFIQYLSKVTMVYFQFFLFPRHETAKFK